MRATVVASVTDILASMRLSSAGCVGWDLGTDRGGDDWSVRSRCVRTSRRNSFDIFELSVWCDST